MANLLMHCGGKQVSRNAIENAPTPEKTNSWTPIAHNRLLELAEFTITTQGFRITNHAHGLWGGGDRYFGLMELSNNQEHEEYSLVLGLRNSHDKTFRSVGLTGFEPATF